MVHTETRYAPHFLIRLTGEEVQQLKECADNHYDATCRALAKPGHGAIINGMLSRLSAQEGAPYPTIEVEISRHDADLLCKVLESAEDKHLYDGLRSLLHIHDLHQKSR